MIFSQVWQGANPKENFDFMDTFLDQTREMGQILPKTFFLFKMSHI